MNGTASGGGYELALACDEIFLVDDGNSAVSLPEVPLLGVLPGTGGLTRVVDKRKVRRDLADVFSTVSEGVRGERAVEWRLVDRSIPRSRFAEAVSARARELAAVSTRPSDPKGRIELKPLARTAATAPGGEDGWRYAHVGVSIDAKRRVAEVTVLGPASPQPETPEGILEMGCGYWGLAAFRELEDALLRLRFNEPEIGTVLLRTRGKASEVLRVDRTLATHAEHWVAREIVGQMRRTLKRIDVSAKSFFALIDGPDSCFAGSLFELALAADRSYMLDDEGERTGVALGALNGGRLPMGNGLTRLGTRFYGEPDREEKIAALLAHPGAFDTQDALAEGLVTFAPDEIDWEDEIRLAVEERAAMSPDALTGMEANLRFPGPETMETKIFGRLTAWQNWIFQRPNAVGEKGALKVYGKAGARPDFDYGRV